MRGFAIKCFAAVLLLGLLGACPVYGMPVSVVADRKTEALLEGLPIPLKSPLISIVQDGIDGSRTYMPVREILEFLGYSVIWNGESHSVNILPKSSNKAESPMVTDVSRVEVYIGYLNIAIAELEEDEGTVWRLCTYEPDDLVFKERRVELDGRIFRSFTVDATRSIPEGRRIITFEKAADGKPTGERLVYEINVVNHVDGGLDYDVRSEARQSE